MASNVQVVLKSEVEHLGSFGQIVKVRRGYARNFRIPRGLAVMATRATMKQAEHERALAEKKAQKLREEQEKMAESLKGVVIMVAKEASPEGKLFGSVTAQDVTEALERKDIRVDKRKLVMPEEIIKDVGTYMVEIKFAYGVRGQVKLEVKTAS